MQRELFRIFDQPVYSYGFFLGIAFVAGWILTFHFVARDGMRVPRIKKIVFVSLIGALFFARVVFFVANPGRWSGLQDFFRFQDGGLVAYGGYLGGILTGYVGFRLTRENFWRFTEHVAPSLALGLMLVRIGCFMNGCDFGKTCGTELAWGVSFPAPSPPWKHHVAQGWIPDDAGHSLAVHPTQIYASLYGFGLFVFLLWARTWRKRFEGQTFLLFLGLYAIIRFLNEYLRDDPQRGAYGIFSTSQWISMGVLLGAVALAVHLARGARNTAAPETS